jgi:hypothetical protein
MSIGNVEVLVIVPVTDETLRHIASMDRRIRVVDARGWFDVEIGETWPRWTVQRYQFHGSAVGREHRAARPAPLARSVTGILVNYCQG